MPSLLRCEDRSWRHPRRCGQAQGSGHRRSRGWRIARCRLTAPVGHSTSARMLPPAAAEVCPSAPWLPLEREGSGAHADYSALRLHASLLQCLQCLRGFGATSPAPVQVEQQVHVPLAAFDLREIRLLNPKSCGQLHLRESCGHPQGTQVFLDGCVARAVYGVGHAAMLKVTME